MKLHSEFMPKKTKKNNTSKTWLQMHLEFSSFGDRLADDLAQIMGSWGFIIWQTVVIIFWISANIYGFTQKWDVYPFILLNLLFSVQAAYAAPIIMMAQNRQVQRDRAQAEADYRTNLDAKREIEELQLALNRLETEKLDKILKAVSKGRK